MCDTCGCGEPKTKITLVKPGEKDESHSDSHSHDHAHAHPHDHHNNSQGRVVEIETDVLRANGLLAERNRGFFEAKNIITLNMVSSPGSGKTTLLEKTIEFLKGEIDLYVIEGDQQSMNDSDRINAAGAKVIQINTGKPQTDN